jgi:hypothetical protein
MFTLPAPNSYLQLLKTSGLIRISSSLSQFAFRVSCWLNVLSSSFQWWRLYTVALSVLVIWILARVTFSAFQRQMAKSANVCLLKKLHFPSSVNKLAVINTNHLPKKKRIGMHLIELLQNCKG